MSFNFNQITDRHNTNAVKLDLAVARGKPADVLSLWVADMDFPTCPAILEALHQRIDHGIFGYSCMDDSFRQALATRSELSLASTPPLLVTVMIVVVLASLM